MVSSGTKGGIPFPIAKSGLEVMWNHLARYRGDTYGMNWNQAAVLRDGSYTLVRFEYEYDFHYGNLSKPVNAREENKLFNFLQVVTAPARLAGQILLVHEYADQVKQPRQAWTYNPGQRRVRLAPNVGYDNPGHGADGLRTNDDFFMYNGATDRYEYKLVGKREIYVPYNSYRLIGNSSKYADVLKPWAFEPGIGALRAAPGLGGGCDAASREPVISTSAAHSTLDEDTWMTVVVDKYDARDELWRWPSSTASISTMRP